MSFNTKSSVKKSTETPQELLCLLLAQLFYKNFTEAQLFNAITQHEEKEMSSLLLGLQGTAQPASNLLKVTQEVWSRPSGLQLLASFPRLLITMSASYLLFWYYFHFLKHTWLKEPLLLAIRCASSSFLPVSRLVEVDTSFLGSWAVSRLSLVHANTSLFYTSDSAARDAEQEQWEEIKIEGAVEEKPCKSSKDAWKCSALFAADLRAISPISGSSNSATTFLLCSQLWKQT